MSRTLIYAHRGANREAAENTRTAFDRALRYAIDGIETDIQISRDGVAVLWHDDDLEKIGLPGRRIDDFDHAQLCGMDFSAHFPGAEREPVMSLRDFVGAYRACCRLLLEIKRYPGEPEARQRAKIEQTLLLARDEARIVVSAFDLDSLLYAHAVAPDIPLVFNLEPEHGARFAREALDGHPWLHGLCVHISTLDEAMSGAVRGHGKRVAVYTCNSEQQILHALNLGVDILISDVPQRALRLRDA